VKCILCGSPDSAPACTSDRFLFHRCGSCGFHWQDESFHLSQKLERERYDLHSNTLSDTGYVKYLSAVADLIEHLPVVPKKILDFGSGKEAVLTGILKGRGFDCEPFDPLYGLEITLPAHSFNAVIANEVIEHFRNPLIDFGTLFTNIRKGGYCIAVTQLVLPGIDLEKWWYIQDPTHIALYELQTIDWIGERFSIPAEIVDEKQGVVIFGPHNEAAGN